MNVLDGRKPTALVHSGNHSFLGDTPKDPSQAMMPMLAARPPVCHRRLPFPTNPTKHNTMPTPAPTPTVWKFRLSQENINMGIQNQRPRPPSLCSGNHTTQTLHPLDPSRARTRQPGCAQCCQQRPPCNNPSERGSRCPIHPRHNQPVIPRLLHALPFSAPTQDSVPPLSAPPNGPHHTHRDAFRACSGVAASQ